jgi:hypothetical protein
MAPAGTPEEIVARLNGAVLAGLEAPALRRVIEEARARTLGGTPGEFRAFLENETSRWRPVVAASGAQVECPCRFPEFCFRVGSGSRVFMGPSAGLCFHQAPAGRAWGKTVACASGTSP